MVGVVGSTIGPHPHPKKRGAGFRTRSPYASLAQPVDDYESSGPLIGREGIKSLKRLAALPSWKKEGKVLHLKILLVESFLALSCARMTPVGTYVASKKGWRTRHDSNV